MSSKGPDEMFCESCGEVIKKEAEICPHCGVRVVGGGSGGTGGTAADSTGTSETDYFGESTFMFPLKYPFSPGWTPLVLGSVMTLLSFLILPMVILYGYVYRIGRAAARGDELAPEFDDWGGMLKDGFLLFVAFLPFGLVVAVIFGAIIGIIVVAESSAVTLVLGFVGVILYIIAAYAGGAIFPAFIATGSITKTYSGGRFLKMAFTKDYLVGFLVLLALNIVVQTAVSIITFVLAITVIGIILAIPIYIAMVPYLGFVLGALWGYVIWDSDDPAFPDVPADAKMGSDF